MIWEKIKDELNQICQADQEKPVIDANETQETVGTSEFPEQPPLDDSEQSSLVFPFSQETPTHPVLFSPNESRKNLQQHEHFISELDCSTLLSSSMYGEIVWDGTPRREIRGETDEQGSQHHQDFKMEESLTLDRDSSMKSFSTTERKDIEEWLQRLLMKIGNSNCDHCYEDIEIPPSEVAMAKLCENILQILGLTFSPNQRIIRFAHTFPLSMQKVSTTTTNLV